MCRTIPMRTDVYKYYSGLEEAEIISQEEHITQLSKRKSFLEAVLIKKLAAKTN